MRIPPTTIGSPSVSNCPNASEVAALPTALTAAWILPGVLHSQFITNRCLASKKRKAVAENSTIEYG
jgi:hypothetical protein